MSQAGVFIGPSGVEYRDRKRHLWIVSLFVPGTVFLGPLMVMATFPYTTLFRSITWPFRCWIC